MSIGEFKRFCKDVWNGAGNYNFVTIDLTSGKMNGKYQIWIASTYRRVYKESIKLIIGIRCLVTLDEETCLLSISKILRSVTLSLLIILQLLREYSREI